MSQELTVNSLRKRNQENELHTLAEALRRISAEENTRARGASFEHHARNATHLENVAAVLTQLGDAEAANRHPVDRDMLSLLGAIANAVPSLTRDVAQLAARYSRIKAELQPIRYMLQFSKLEPNQLGIDALRAALGRIMAIADED
jgi:hypothetical protein